ncbi:MAG: SRPBCC family protein [Hyphomicrobiales bacterium]|nr:SRPBCC family protein [Hyphomicrobiales bacterium]
MLKAITIGAAVLAVIIAGILAYAATRPDRFAVERSIVIAAPAETIFPFINDLRSFNSWNPFDKKEGIKGDFSGPPAGKGARYSFDSRRAGTGSIEIIDTAPPTRVSMRLLMSKPMAADNRVTFLLEPLGGPAADPVAKQTRVTWRMEGASPFIGKLVQVFLDMDKMVGGEFATGLADLKALAERPAAAATR